MHRSHIFAFQIFRYETMKRFGFLLCLWVALGLRAVAQPVLLTFDGQVLISQSSQVPLPAYQVNVDILAGGALVTDSTLTDAAGMFLDSIFLSPTQTQGLAVVRLQDCFGLTVSDTFFFSPGNTAFSNLTFYFCDSVQNPVTCAAGFVAQSLTGGTYLFTSTSIPSSGGTIVSTEWDFNNGTVITGNPVPFTFNQPGTYQVCLTITDDQGCTDTHCEILSIIVPGFCQAFFTAIDQGQQTVSFNNFSTPGTYQWFFGDGSAPSTAVNPVHTFPVDSTYLVCLVVIDTSCTDTICIPVQVGNPVSNCNASFIYFSNDPLNPSEVAFFSDSLTNFNVSHFWDFGDGTTSTGVNPVQVHTYNGPGPFYVCHTVTDTAAGCTDTFCDSVYLFAPPICQAIFGFDTVGLTASFLDFSVYDSTAGPATFHWDFGDGNTSTLMNPTHTYAGPGDYVVCLTLTTASGCVVTGCQLVSVGGSAGCSADFGTSSIGPNMVLLIAQQGNYAPSSYTWDLGDGSVVSGVAAYVHTYAQPGTYLVCLTIADTASGCTQTVCNVVVVSSGGGFCQADFGWNQTASGTFAFVNNSLPSVPWVTYLWDFGDGNTSTALNPVHTYTGQGPWTVCLTMADSASGCTSTICDVVGLQGVGLSVFGQVWTGNQPVFNGIAYLIQHDSLAGTLTAVDSTFIFAGHYNFSAVSPGTYLVKAALTPADPNYSAYLPTYFGDELFWDDATSLVVTNATLFLPPISLIAGNNPGGPGFIGGLVSQGANKQEGDPLANMSVLLMDANGNPVAHTTTDAQGQFAFPNLPYGTYMVYVEVAGVYRTPWIVTIGPDNPSATQVNFEMNDTGVHPANTTSIGDQLDAQALQLYPNPAGAYIQVALTLEQAGEVTWYLRNPLGQLLQRQQTRFGAGAQELRLDLSTLPAGTYLLQVQTPEGRASRRFVKQ